MLLPLSKQVSFNPAISYISEFILIGCLDVDVFISGETSYIGQEPSMPPFRYRLIVYRPSFCYSFVKHALSDEVDIRSHRRCQIVKSKRIKHLGISTAL